MTKSNRDTENAKSDTQPDVIRQRYETLLQLFDQQFVVGLDKRYYGQVFISKELLHCAVKAYFDDITRYKTYAGSEYADRHKQAGYTIKWLSRFRPIQLTVVAKPDTTLLTINESFALYAGIMFLAPTSMENMSRKLFKHLIYSITYRELSGKGLSTLMYLVECAAAHGKEI